MDKKMGDIYQDILSLCTESKLNLPEKYDDCLKRATLNHNIQRVYLEI